MVGPQRPADVLLAVAFAHRPIRHFGVQVGGADRARHWVDYALATTALAKAVAGDDCPKYHQKRSPALGRGRAGLEHAKGDEGCEGCHAAKEAEQDAWKH